jgi:ketosteroid isomerase-like protein
MATMTERDTIVRTVLDYYEGWFDGDTKRMDRALHPDLVKRRVAEELGVTTKERMLELTAQGVGAEDAADRRVDVEVEDVHRTIANVTARTAVYHEYIQLVRTSEGWKIANVLWEPT